jgi:hypothetical protein
MFTEDQERQELSPEYQIFIEDQERQELSPKNHLYNLQ